MKKPARNYRRYRKKHQHRRNAKRHIMILGGIAVVICLATVAIVSSVLLFRHNKAEPLTPSNPPQIISTPASEPPVNPNVTSAATEGEFAYQSLYPDLYVPIVEKIPAEDGDKVVYLTYDDGPSELTPQLLDVLDGQGVKATFFVMAQGKSTEDCKKWLKMIADRGHAIGVHTYSHQYKEIYASPKAFLEDFKKMRDLIFEATGQEVTVFRFAGGSVNAYNQETCKAIIDEMTRRGYTYFDWNIDCGDSEVKNKGKDIYTITVNAIKRYDKSIVLMHNSKSKTDTLAQTGAIIQEAKKNGYRFDVLTPSVKPFTFRIPDPPVSSQASSQAGSAPSSSALNASSQPASSAPPSTTSAS